jgi:DNA replication protein DnaC
MLAVALRIKAVDAGHRVLFLTLETLITRLRRAQTENRCRRNAPAPVPRQRQWLWWHRGD